MSNPLERARTLSVLRFSDLNSLGRQVPTRELARRIASNQHLIVDAELNIANRRMILDAIHGNGNLKTVTFRFDQGMGGGLSLNRMKSLEKATFSGMVFDVGETMTLQLNRNLQELDVIGGSMGDTVADAVARVVRFRSCLLAKISFRLCGLSNKGLATIGQSLQSQSMLTEVTVCDHSRVVEDEAAAVFAQGIETNTSVQKLVFRHLVHLAGWKCIIRALAVNRTLTEVCLWLHGREQSIETACLLAANGTMKELHLGGRNIYMPPIANALASNRSLRTLCLDVMDTVCVRHTCDALESNDTVEHLVLKLGEITVDGILSIGRMLTNNSTLKSLGLKCLGSSLLIDRDKAVSLSESLKQNRSLVSLNLTGCLIDDHGAAAIADYISSSLLIKKVDLPCTSILDTGYVAFGSALKQNTSLEEFNLVPAARVPGSGSPWHSERGMRAILDGVKVHPTIKAVRIASLSNTAQKDELDFYLERNKQAKPILHANHLPLSIWPRVLKRADDCRHTGDNRLLAPDMLYFFVKEKSEIFARGPSSRKRKRADSYMKMCVV